MFLASIAHMLAFPVDPYRTDSSTNWIWNIASAANVSDLHYEVAEHYSHFHGKMRRALKRNSSIDTGLICSERSNLLANGAANEETDSGW